MANPYAPPSHAYGSYGPYGAAPVGSGHVYRPLGARTGLAMAGMIADVVAQALLVAATATWGHELTGDDGEIGAGAFALMGAAGLTILVSILSAVFFCVWVHRASTNAWAFQRYPMSITPGWAVGWFFVPIASLWKPLQAIREVWNASSAEAWGSSGLVSGWWAAWVISNVLARVTARVESIPLDGFHVLVHGAAAALGILVIREIARRQEALASGERRFG